MVRRRPVKWNIVFLGFGIFAFGIIMVLFWDTWGNRTNVINPIGFVLVFVSIFIIGWGFRIKMPKDSP